MSSSITPEQAIASGFYKYEIADNGECIFVRNFDTPEKDGVITFANGETACAGCWYGRCSLHCTLCCQTGHADINCHRSVTCGFCGKQGHIAKKCYKLQKITCTFCGKRGHTSSRCLELYTTYCNKCGLYGHTKTKCFYPAKTVEYEYASNLDVSDRIMVKCPHPNNKVKETQRTMGIILGFK